VGCRYAPSEPGYTHVSLTPLEFLHSSCIYSSFSATFLSFSLDLRSNDIGPRGGETIFNALETNCSLTSLNISGLSSGINRYEKRNKHLFLYFFQRNHVGLRGAFALARVLEVNEVFCHV
jgi:hypothetical protein